MTISTSSLDGDVGLFGPGSVTWRIHADHSGLIGGLRALLIQALHPLAMAAVAQHSDFKNDPWGRLQRTSDYIMITTFGDTASAHAAAGRVRAIHRRVRGVDDVTGLPYRADDPELLLWIHAVEVDSFIAAYRRFARGLGRDDADRYVAEMVRAAELVGLHAEDVPATEADLRDYLASVRGLRITPAAREGMSFVLNPPMRLALRPLWTVPSAAAISLLPARFRRMYGIPWVSVADPVVRASVFSLTRALNVVMPDPPEVRKAKARVRTASAA